MNPLPMVLADLRAMRWTALAVPLIVALAVGSAIAIAAQERMIRGGTARAAEDFDLVVGAAGSETQLVTTSVYLDLAALTLVDGRVLNALATDPRVAAAAPLAFGDVIGGHPVVGTSAAFATRWGRIAPAEGRVFAREGEALVGADAPFRLGATLVPAHGAGHHDADEEAEHRHEGVRYEVVGRLPRQGTPWDRAILVPVETVWETHGLGNGHRREGALGPPYDAEIVPGVPAVVVKPRGIADAYALRQAYRRDGTVAVFPAEVLVSLYRRMGDVRDVLLVASWLNTILIFAAVALLVALLTGLRRRRYAVLRALGAPARFILATVWLGAVVLVGSGAAAGLVLGWGGAWLVGRLVEGRTGLALSLVPALSDGLVAAGLALCGTALALLPAMLAGRTPPAGALRAG